uniref:CLIP domain-containing serine protease n=1 Tax=Strongyloides venezuelensis TaxID=75913 RepID=A0A0K0G4J9_STRVS
MFIYQFILLLFLSLFFKIYATITLPLAPFQIKIQCKSGLSSGNNGYVEKKEVCPASSTSCAYIEIPNSDNTISVYECVDSSILSGEDDGEEMIKQNLFFHMCNHIPKCQMLNSSLLNPTFKKYLSSTYKLPQFALLNKKLTFCCSMNSGILEKILKSKDKSQKLKTTNSLQCNNVTCGVGAIGCLSYQQFPKVKIINGQDYIDEIKDNSYDSNESYNEDNSYEDKNISKNNYLIEPIQIEFNEEFDQIYRKKRGIKDSEKNAINKVYECVYPHLNNEVYRYCTMIYSNLNDERCYNGKGFKICCCYVRPNMNTCEPSEKELPPTITLPPKIIPYKNIVNNDTISITTTTSQIELLKTSTIKPTTFKVNITTTNFKLNNVGKNNNGRNYTRSYNKSTNKKCKFVTRQKMRRLQNDRLVPYFYKQEICDSSTSRNLFIISSTTVKFIITFIFLKLI